jgi:hypothetical protein
MASGQARKGETPNKDAVSRRRNGYALTSKGEKDANASEPGERAPAAGGVIPEEEAFDQGRWCAFAPNVDSCARPPAAWAINDLEAFASTCGNLLVRAL